MKFGSVGVLAIGLVALSTTGCAKFPIQKDNVLNSPIHIKMPATDGVVFKPKDEFIAEVLSGLDRYMIDDFARAKATEFVEVRYNSEFKVKRVNPEERIKMAIINVLSTPNNFITHQGGKLFNASSGVQNVRVSWNGNNGVVFASLYSNWNIHGFYHKGLIDMTMNLAKQYDDKTISADISSLTYILNCSYGHDTTCLTKDALTVADQTLAGELQKAYSAPDPSPSIDSLRSRLVSYLDDRYVNGRLQSVDKISKTYHLDFVTAKSRLQRSLETFKYDDKNSVFEFDREYANPLRKDKKVKHTYTISLFPDRNDTVIEFKGNFQVFTDSYSDKEMYGKSEFDSELSGYIAFVTKTLNR